MDKTLKIILLATGSLALLASILGISISLANKSGGSGTVDIGQSSSQTESSSVASNSSSPEESSGSGSANVTDSPYLKGDKTSIEMSMSNSETTFPESSFTVSINNVPSDATSRAKTDLAINWCNQPEVLDYLYFYVLNDAGQEVSCGASNAQIFYSGKPCYVRQKMKAPIYGGWTCQLLIHSPYYDSSICEWPISITLTTLA